MYYPGARNVLADAPSRLHKPWGGPRLLSLLASMSMPHQSQQCVNRPLLITLWFQETGDASSRLLKAFTMREVLSFCQQTFASNTKKGYRTHRNAYFPFCNSIWDIPQFLLLHGLSAYVYTSFLARSLKYNSVKHYPNILRILHLEWGFPNPLLDNFYLRCVLQGMRRELGDAVNRKLPITPALLRSILSHFDMSVSVDIVIWAACLSRFHGLLCRSSLMPLSRSTFDASRHLRRRDITFHPWGCELVILWSITIQFKSLCLGIPLPRRKDSLLCPVAAIFQATSLTAAACPALVMPSPQGFQPLTANIFLTGI